MDLHELAPVGGRYAGGRHGRRLGRLAEVGENLPDRPRLRDERDEPDFAAARWALKGKLLSHPGHEFRPRHPRGVVRAGLFMWVAAASRGVIIARMPTGGGVTPLTNVPDGECRDGPPELVIRGEHHLVAVPVLPRRRDEIGESVEELKRCEFDDAICARPRRLPPATGADPGSSAGGRPPWRSGETAPPRGPRRR